MTRVLTWLSAATAIIATATADSVLKNEFGQREICGGVYGQEDSSGPFHPGVNVTFPSKEDTAGEVAVIIFNFEDVSDIGFESSDGHGGSFVKYMCDQASVYSGECSNEDLGKFFVNKNARDKIFSRLIQFEDGKAVEDIHFPVKHTGYYCVAAEATPGHESMKYNVEVKFQNAFGHLPGADYPLILFHFVLSLTYLLALIVWTVPMVLHRHNVLKVQKYITAMAGIMVLEQFFVALYYYIVNKIGVTAGTKAMLIFVAFWASARLSFTFFLFLIVGCGYSVVHPSLGSKMNKCRILGGLLFVTCLIFSTLTYYESNTENSGSWLELASNITFFPFALALGINYFAVFASFGETITYLRSRKQSAKEHMYRYLTVILLGSVIAIGLQILVIIIQLLVVPLKTFVISYWQYKWVLYDGWPNIVYLVALLLIMFIWRPSKDNMRYAMSTQLSQNEDAEEFEIGSLHGSDDELPEEPQQAHHEDNQHSVYEHTDNVGAQRNSNLYDAEVDGLSDFDSGDEFEVRPEDRDPVDDENPLVSAPTKQLRKHR